MMCLSGMRKPPAGDVWPAQGGPHVREEYRPSPAHFPLRLPSGRLTPSAHAADAAMARARRRSRTPEGRTERRSRRGHHPAGTAGKVRADAPRATRRAGYSPTQETIFALPPSGEYGGAGGVEGQPPLSPHAPRRAGDPPPVPGSRRHTQRLSGSNTTSPHVRGEDLTDTK